MGRWGQRGARPEECRCEGLTAMLFSQSDSLVLLAATMSEMKDGQACGHSWCSKGKCRLSISPAVLACARAQGDAPAVSFAPRVARLLNDLHQDHVDLVHEHLVRAEQLLVAGALDDQVHHECFDASALRRGGNTRLGLNFPRPEHTQGFGRLGSSRCVTRKSGFEHARVPVLRAATSIET